MCVHLSKQIERDTVNVRCNLRLSSEREIKDLNAAAIHLIHYTQSGFKGVFVSLKMETKLIESEAFPSGYPLKSRV